MRNPVSLWLPPVLGALLLTATPGCATPASDTPAVSLTRPENAWTLLWHDEFNGDRLDERSWSRVKRGTADWNNTKSDAPRLVQVRRGSLLLLGVENPDRSQDPSPFLTGGVTSKEKFNFQYGKIRIRARFKSARGAWPALWMLGTEGGWPHCGEIDLMEHLNLDSIVYQTVHSAHTRSGAEGRKPPNSTTARIDRNAWNTYGCEWTAEEIVFTVNGRPTHRYPRQPERGDHQWPFDQPFYLIFSMQIGGDWVNSYGPTDPADYPAGMEIDWVRVYQANNDPVPAP